VTVPIFEYQHGTAVYEAPHMQSPYPVWLLPPIVADAISEVSANLQVPVELAAHAALGTVSLICQNFVNIQCPNFDAAPCSLFLMAISNSSGGKSLAERRFLRSVSAFEREREEYLAVKMTAYRAELKIWLDDDRQLSRRYRGAALGSDDACAIREQRLLHEKIRPKEPLATQLRYAELSPQGLRDMMVTNSSLGILSAEAGPTVNGATFREPAMLSGLWSGEDRNVGLVSGSRRAVEPRLTVSVMLQESKFTEYMKSRGKDAFGTGLLARFLVLSPKHVNSLEQKACVDEVLEPKLDLFNERAAFILNQPFPGTRKRLALKLSDGAKYYWKLFKDGTNNELTGGNYSEDIKSFLRKLGQTASRLAALFHYFDGKPGDISSQAMKSAIALCEWYVFEYFRIFASYAPSHQQKCAEATLRLQEWLHDAAANSSKYPRLTPGRYPERDLANYCIRKDRALLREAINTLHQRGEVLVTTGKNGGKIVLYPAADPCMSTSWSGQITQPRSSSTEWPPSSMFGVHVNPSFITAALIRDRDDAGSVGQAQPAPAASAQQKESSAHQARTLFDEVRVRMPDRNPGSNT
jgi:hypothetical protein